MLAAGVVASTWQAVRARKAERLAQQQTAHAEQAAASAQAVTDFLQNDLLAQASSYAQSESGSKPDPDMTVRTALDRAAQRSPGKFDKQPEIEVSVRQVIGAVYYDLALFPQAIPHLQRELELCRAALGPDDPKTLRAMSFLGELLESKGDYAGAEALPSQTLEIEQRLYSPEHPDTLATMDRLAMGYYFEGKYEQAESLYIKNLDITRRVFGSENPQTVGAMTRLALVYNVTGRYSQEAALDSQTLSIVKRILGPQSLSTARGAPCQALPWLEWESALPCRVGATPAPPQPHRGFHRSSSPLTASGEACSNSFARSE